MMLAQVFSWTSSGNFPIDVQKLPVVASILVRIPADELKQYEWQDVFDRAFRKHVQQFLPDYSLVTQRKLSQTPDQLLLTAMRTVSINDAKNQTGLHLSAEEAAELLFKLSASLITE